ncbi:Glycosyltransferase family 15 protein [Mycena chlorophos]|uniref:Glycosyltransferase family 15 protein n=1 Tax=Mycena chlorophos TaxID=658473 RepID=A0A8H6SBL6_MYCCL|nr:Glycosyltransferase family 15 protein [Mycena chlorophos]
MMTKTRYIFVALAILISLHYILSFSHEGYGKATSFDNLKAQWEGFRGQKDTTVNADGPVKVWHEPPYKTPVPEKYFLNGTFDKPTRRASAAIVSLARNGDLNGIIRSMTQMEEKFNHRFGYPYVFLNEEPFSEEFKRSVSGLTNNLVEFGLIPHDHWFQPDWIDEEKATKNRQWMIDNNVIYGGSVPYRNMCRFNSGFFFRHPLLDKYRYYWRMEPDVRYFCTLSYDPFLFMQDEGKKYGFTISLPEYGETITTLWDAVKEFVRDHPEHVVKDNAMGFLSDDNGDSYNRCHFWSNFEIGDLDLWRGDAYMKFFDYLDSKGGFYYERWGDAPVHSIGAALFARKDQIHFFEDVGYRHEPFQHCPQEPLHSQNHCSCDAKENFDREGWSCLNRYDRIFT